MARRWPLNDWFRDDRNGLRLGLSLFPRSRLTLRLGTAGLSPARDRSFFEPDDIRSRHLVFADVLFGQPLHDSRNDMRGLRPKRAANEVDQQ